MEMKRLSGRKINRYVLKKGQVWRGATCQIHYVLGVPINCQVLDKQIIFMGTYAPTSLHKHSVVRNRMRRRLKEACRLQLQVHDNLPSIQLLIRPKSSSLVVPFSYITQDIYTFFSKFSTSLS